MSLPGILLAALAGSAVLAALTTALAWAYARRWCAPRRRPPATTPADVGLAFEETHFWSRGVPIRGWFMPAGQRSPPGPAIVLVHGWSANAADMLPLAPALNAAGFSLLAYDARGHGGSGADGPITIRKLAEDVVAAVEYLKRRPDVDQDRLGVLGHSIGGGAAILAASAEPRIRAVVSASAFACPEALTRGVMARQGIPAWPLPWLVIRFIQRWLGASMAEMAPENRIARTRARLLLLHGATDRFIPASNLGRLYARAPRECAHRMLVTGRGHSDLIRDPGTLLEIVAFLSRALEIVPARVLAPRPLAALG